LKIDKKNRSEWVLKLSKPAKLQEGIEMDNISNQIRAKLKQLCPYVGSYIPNSVRQNANMQDTTGRHLMTRTRMPAGGGMRINGQFYCATRMLILSTRQGMSRFVP
jgi:hypothetical protein